MYGQCANNSNFSVNGGAPPCGEYDTVQVVLGEWAQFDVVTGAEYEFGTCGMTSIDTEITAFEGNNAVNVFHNDDACGVQSSKVWVATFTGTLRVLVHEFGCLGSTNSVGLWFRQISANLFVTSSDLDMCVGSSRTLTASQSGGTWSGTGVSGNTFTPPSAGNYIVSYTLGACVSTDTIDAIPQITNNALNNATAFVCGAYDPPELTPIGPVMGGNGSFLYNWESSPNGAVWNIIVGALDSTYDPPLTTSSVFYRRIVTSSTCTSISNVITISVTPSTITNNTISASGAMGPYCSGGDPDMLLGTMPSGGSGGFTYEWQSSTDSMNWMPIGSATALDYDPGALTETTWFRRAATSGSCTEISDPLKVIVNTPPTDPSAAMVSNAFLCASGDNVELTISGGSMGSNGNIVWYSGSCGGMMVGMGDSLSVSVNATTTYYGRYEGCDTSNCVMVTVTVNDPVALTMVDGDQQSCASNGLNQWLHLTNNSGEVIASINDNGISLGNVTATTYIASSSTVPMNPTSCAGTIATMRRHYLLQSDQNWSGTVNVRLYFTDAELDSLISVSQSNSAGGGCEDEVFSIADLKVTRYKGANDDDDLSNNSAIAGDYDFISPTANNTAYGGNYVEFTVTNTAAAGFSEFWLHGAVNQPFPIELTSFLAQAIDNRWVRINWETSSETNNRGFGLERSVDGQQFEEIAWYDGAGNSNTPQYYTHQDEDILPGTVYFYRLKQVDLDGSIQYSNRVQASFLYDQSLTIGELAPNPASTEVHLVFDASTAQSVQVRIVDNLGRVLVSQRYTLTLGSQSLSLPIQALTDGIYHVEVIGEEQLSKQKLVIRR